MRSLWAQLRRDEPHLLSNFEEFLARVTYQIKEATQEKNEMETALKRSDINDINKVLSDIFCYILFSLCDVLCTFWDFFRKQVFIYYGSNTLHDFSDTITLLPPKIFLRLRLSCHFCVCVRASCPFHCAVVFFSQSANHKKVEQDLKTTSKLLESFCDRAVFNIGKR